MSDGPVSIEPSKQMVDSIAPKLSSPLAPPALDTSRPPQPNLEQIIANDTEERLLTELELNPESDPEKIRARREELRKEVRERYAGQKGDEGGEEEKPDYPSPATGTKAKPLAESTHTQTGTLPKSEPTEQEKTIEEKQAEYRKHWGQGDDSALGHLLGIDWSQMTIPDEKKTAIKAVQAQYNTLNQAIKEARARSENGIYYIRDPHTGKETPFIQTEEMVKTVLTAEDILAADTTDKDRAKTASENAAILRESLTDEGYFKARTASEIALEKEAKERERRENTEIEIAERVLLTLVGPDIGDLEKAKSHANPRIARIAQLIYYSKRDGATDIQRKSAYTALHYELKSFRSNTSTPETQELAQFDGIYSQEMGQIKKAVRDILQVAGYKEADLLHFDAIPEEQLLGHLSLASACEGKLINDAKGQPQLPLDAQITLNNLVNTSQLDAFAPHFILALAHNSAASGILQARFGILREDMKNSKKTIRTIAHFVSLDMEKNPRIQDIITQKKTEGIIPAEASTQDIEDALYTHTIESFENFKKVFKIPTWILILAGLGAMFAQPIGELMKTGEPESEQRR